MTDSQPKSKKPVKKKQKKETLLKFPCEFPIKVVGPAGDQFEIDIIMLVRKHAPDLSETSIQVRKSRDGTYQALTITIHAKSQKQLDAIYQDISKNKQVLFAL